MPDLTAKHVDLFKLFGLDDDVVVVGVGWLQTQTVFIRVDVLEGRLAVVEHSANAAVGDILVPGDPEGKDALQVGEEGLQCDHPEMGVNGLLEAVGRDQANNGDAGLVLLPEEVVAELFFAFGSEERRIVEVGVVDRHLEAVPPSWPSNSTRPQAPSHHVALRALRGRQRLVGLSPTLPWDRSAAAR